MEIDLPWTAAIAELRSMESPAGTETAGVTGIVGATVMVLAPEEWLLEAVAVLGLAGAALAASGVRQEKVANWVE